jgi:hypothetical protein
MSFDIGFRVNQHNKGETATATAASALQQMPRHFGMGDCYPKIFAEPNRTIMFSIARLKVLLC